MSHLEKSASVGPRPVAAPIRARRIGFDGVFAIIALILGASPFFALLVEQPGGIFLKRLMQVSVYLVLFVLLFVRFRGRWIVWSLRRLPTIMMVLAIAMASFSWSIDPSTTLLRSLLLVGTTLIGVFIGLRFSPSELMRILYWVFAILIVTSVISALADPDLGTMGTSVLSDSWKGIFSHKNTLGRVATIGVLFFFLVTSLGGASGRPITIALLSLSLVTVVMSQSATSFVITFGGLALLILCTVSRKLRLSGGLFIFLLVICLGSFLLVLSGIAEWVLALLGRDITFTGRTRIWTVAFQIIEKRPLTGLGYAVVWGEAGSSIVASKLGLEYIGGLKGAAHNGFLNLATEIGIPATVLTFGYVGLSFYRSIRYYLQSPSPFLLFAAVFIFMYILQNLTEVSILRYQQISWILFIAIVVAVTRIGEIRQ